MEDALIEDWKEAGAPSPMSMWEEVQGKAQPPDDEPLTVAQAAIRENCSTKTIRRRLDDLTAMEPVGAYKIGAAWRIVPAALDALHESPQRSTPPSGRRKRKPTAPTGKPSTRWEV